MGFEVFRGLGVQVFLFFLFFLVVGVQVCARSGHLAWGFRDLGV